MKSTKGQKFHKNILKRFAIVQLQQIYSRNKNIHWFVIDDDTAQQLGIKDSIDGSMYFLLKSSIKLDNKYTLETDGNKFLIAQASSLINKKVQDVIEELSNKYNQISIFASKSFELPHPNYTLVLETDLNKMQHLEVQNIIKMFIDLREYLQKHNPKLASQIEFININRHIEKSNQKYKIYIRDDIKSMDKSQEHSITDINQMKQLSTFNNYAQSHTYTYLFQSQASVELLKQFIEDVQNQLVPEYFKSQKTPKYFKYSIKLSGKAFKQLIINHPQTCIVFHYSKHCHACRQYGKDYEDIVLQSLIQKQEIRYSRLNNDRNQLDCSLNFGYTPVFEVLKKNLKDKPYIYRHQKFTKELLQTFFRITDSFNLINETEFKEIQKQYSLI